MQKSIKDHTFDGLLNRPSHLLASETLCNSLQRDSSFMVQLQPLFLLEKITKTAYSRLFNSRFQRKEFYITIETLTKRAPQVYIWKIHFLW